MLVINANNQDEGCCGFWRCFINICECQITFLFSILLIVKLIACIVVFYNILKDSLVQLAIMMIGLSLYLIAIYIVFLLVCLVRLGKDFNHMQKDQEKHRELMRIKMLERKTNKLNGSMNASSSQQKQSFGVMHREITEFDALAAAPRVLMADKTSDKKKKKKHAREDEQPEPLVKISRRKIWNLERAAGFMIFGYIGLELAFSTYLVGLTAILLPQRGLVITASSFNLSLVMLYIGIGFGVLGLIKIFLIIFYRTLFSSYFRKSDRLDKKVDNDARSRNLANTTRNSNYSSASSSSSSISSIDSTGIDYDADDDPNDDAKMTPMHDVADEAIDLTQNRDDEQQQQQHKYEEQKQQQHKYEEQKQQQQESH